jgi:hypothetical protein
MPANTNHARKPSATWRRRAIHALGVGWVRLVAWQAIAGTCLAKKSGLLKLPAPA